MLTAGRTGGRLERQAAARIRWEPPRQTLRPTALVHEAYLRLVYQRVLRHNRALNSMRGVRWLAMNRGGKARLEAGVLPLDLRLTGGSADSLTLEDDLRSGHLSGKWNVVVAPR